MTRTRQQGQGSRNRATGTEKLWKVSKDNTSGTDKRNRTPGAGLEQVSLASEPRQDTEEAGQNKKKVFFAQHTVTEMIFQNIKSLGTASVHFSKS